MYRNKKKKNKTKFLINLLFIILILILLIWLSIQKHEEDMINKIANSASLEGDFVNTKSTKELENENSKNGNTEKSEYPKEKIIEEYKAYKVEAKLEIPEISLETYVLKEFSSNALNISVTKFWGANANCIGNFCIAGHNFKNSNMFHNLKKLNIGDKIIITDNNIGKIEYQIYQIDIVLPANVDCLDQETNGEKTVTLITCTNDSAKRIIVKAKEIKE